VSQESILVLMPLSHGLREMHWATSLQKYIFTRLSSMKVFKTVFTVYQPVGRSPLPEYGSVSTWTTKWLVKIVKES